MKHYNKTNPSELTLLEISAEMGYSVQLLPDGIAPAQDGGEIPTESEIEAYRQTAWDKIQKRKYKVMRANDYPYLKEQLGMLFNDIENGTLDKTGEFYQAIKAVKDNNPKGE